MMRPHLWYSMISTALLMAAVVTGIAAEANDIENEENKEVSRQASFLSLCNGRSEIYMKWVMKFHLGMKLKKMQASKAYVPPVFVEPKVSGSPLFVDWFADDSAIGKRWIKSKGKKDNMEDSIAKYNGEWEIGPPAKVIFEGDLGLIVKTKARHHAIAANLTRPFKFDGKPLVVQYEVKYEDGQECGGGYVKLLSEASENKLEEFTDKTPYTIMFGPDKCGADPKVRFIVRHKNPKNGVVTEHHAKQPTKSVSSYFDDHRTHLYTLIVRPDESFIVMVDNNKIMSGDLRYDMEPSVTPPALIDDTEDKKPADWDEREEIDDPNARKPDDWDENAPRKIEDANAEKPDDWLEDEQPLIPDPDVTRPSDWDDSMDGEWEAPKIDNPKCKDVSGCGKWTRPMIANPDYKGKWKPPRIANPAYKGKWKPRQIDNPDSFDPHPYSQLSPITAIGIELWTMSANIIFDNIYVADSEQSAADFGKQTFMVKIAKEAEYENAASPSQNIISKLVTATDERPWLWIVYVLSLLIPIILVAVVCFGRKNQPSISDHKKTDEPQIDDEIPDLVDDDSAENSAAEPEDVKSSITFDEVIATDKRTSQSSSRSGSQGSEDNVSTTSEQATEDWKTAEHNSARVRRSRQRKQD